MYSWYSKKCLLAKGILNLFILENKIQNPILFEMMYYWLVRYSVGGFPIERPERMEAT